MRFVRSCSSSSTWLASQSATDSLQVKIKALNVVTISDGNFNSIVCLIDCCVCLFVCLFVGLLSKSYIVHWCIGCFAAVVMIWSEHCHPVVFVGLSEN